MWRALLGHLFVDRWPVQWHLSIIALLLPVLLVVAAERQLRRDR